jgi:hypothetical protein
MTVARSTALVALGAVLYFAPNPSLGIASLDVLGLALMVAGDVGLLWALIGHAVWSRRARRAS